MVRGFVPAGAGKRGRVVDERRHDGIAVVEVDHVHRPLGQESWNVKGRVGQVCHLVCVRSLQAHRVDQQHRQHVEITRVKLPGLQTCRLPGGSGFGKAAGRIVADRTRRGVAGRGGASSRGVASRQRVECKVFAPGAADSAVGLASGSSTTPLSLSSRPLPKARFRSIFRPANRSAREQ